MKNRIWKIIAVLLSFSIVFTNLFPATESEVSLSPVMTAQAATVTDAKGEYVLNIGTEYYKHKSEVSIDRDMTVQLMYVDSAGTVLPIEVTTGTSITIDWNVVDDNNIVTNTVFTATGISKSTSGILNYCNLVIKGIGYSNISVRITVNNSITGTVTTIDYSWKLVVKLAIDSSNQIIDSAIYDSDYGLTYAFSTDKSRNTILIAGPEVLTDGDASNDKYNKYLLLLKKASLIYTYTAVSGSVIQLNNYSTETDIEQSTTLRNLLQEKIIWTTSDSTVATVQYGVIKGVGAGRAIITATTTSEDGVSTQSVSMTVIVQPTGYLLDSTQPSQPFVKNFTKTVASDSFTVVSNAADATNLVWTVYNKDVTGDVIWTNQYNKPTDVMEVSVYDTGGSVFFSNVKAGTYYVTARVSTDYAENNTMISKFDFTIVVPVTIPSGPIFMNVNDVYNIIDNSSMPVPDWYSYTSSDVGIASVVNGVITAKGFGTTTINMVRIDGSGYADYFDPTDIDLKVPPIKSIQVQVIDAIYLNYSSATIYKGATLNLVAYTTNNKIVTWTTSNKSVATVAVDGTVTAVAEGSAVITATQVVNGVSKTATCKVTVRQSVTSIVLTPATSELGIGDNLTISAKVTPSLNGVSLKWVSSNSSIVSILTTGDLSTTVTGVAGGTAVITAINQDNVVVGSCLITVYAKITGITLSQTNVILPLSAGWFQLFTTILPATAKGEDVVWTSTDKSIATVANGIVTLLKPGKTSIIVSSSTNSAVTSICNLVVTTSVAGIKLDTTTKDMYIGETFRITYIINPTTASNAAVTWTSSNTSVASVDANGLISAKGVGSTVIIAKTKDGGYTATCNVTVGALATAVKFDVTKLILNVDDYYTLETILTPANTTETSVQYDSSDKAVASVNKKGKVIAKEAGTTIILAKTRGGSVAYCTVTVLQSVTGVEVSEKEADLLIGQTLELTATFIPDVVSNDIVTWSSSDPKVAKVDKDGEVTGVAGGTAIITCTTDDGGYKDFCVVTVIEEVTEVTLNRSFVKLGLNVTYRLVATVTGESASNKGVTWSSSKPSIVSIDKNGRMKGLALGYATITCTAADGSGAEDTCEVRVTKLVTSIDLDVTYLTLIQGRSYSIDAKVYPSDATYDTPIWSSEDNKIAIVDKKGVVTALAPGDVVIRASANDSSEVSSICYVHVIAPVSATNISISESEVVMSPGETKTVAISLVPANTTESFSWSSDNTVVATVDSKTGLITAGEIGTANITVMTESGRKGTIKVYVVGLSRTYVELQQYTSLLLRLEVDGSGSTSFTVRWDVDNQEVATVTNGNIVAKAIGTTTVYAVVNGRRLSCVVKVVKVDNQKY